MTSPDIPSGAIAIVGMSGRFPGASDLAAFWQNLRAGVESITFFTDEELLAAGVDAETLRRPEYVRARSLLEGAALFDAEFFGYTPREAAHMDPQHRLFLECASEALERAGCDSERYPGAIGVYAGLYMNTYLLANVVTDRAFIRSLLSFKHPGAFQTFLGNDKDYLTSRVAYKLNLRGPGVTVQTACSTSLVAVAQACQSLLAFGCDMALAGGVTVSFPEKKGYLHEEGGMLSPDGHCRAFDARAEGTVFGNGLGIVVLKRLEDALAEGDAIHAIIRAAALNNDGAVKVSYAAPSIDGQAEVIALAHAVAGVSADTIDYVEAHGTGTPLGDPIEIAALTKAFRQTTDAVGFCKLGALKTNIGHLDVAAGVAGLIKTALALEHREIPPTLHFTEGNPKIAFAESPFRVVTELTPWERRGHPRRGGVSSFGVGGTNAHVVLEEAPERAPSPVSMRPALLLLSAKTPAALERMSARLGAHLRSEPDANLADVAWTLQTGRRVFAHRRFVVGDSARDLATALEGSEKATVQERRDVPVIFMFPGQGAQALRMGEGLYRTEPVYRAVLDECAALLAPHLGCDLREVLFPASNDAEAEARLRETRFTQPALFATEYALALLWFSWGIRPAAMIGHSVGEYVAACLAGVFSLPDALALVANRARLVQEQPGGAMLAVRLPEADLAPRLSGSLAIAAVNAPSLCVAAGPDEEIAALESRLTADGVACKRLATSHAFHSPMMQGAVEPFVGLARGVSMQAPAIPLVSCLTGAWLTEEQAASPDYWASHLRETVRFSDALAALLRDHQDAILLEAGPGQTLFQAARASVPKTSATTLISSLPPGADEPHAIASALGRLWLAGATIDWGKLHAGQGRRRVPLPTYPFDRQRHWVEPPADLPAAESASYSASAAPLPLSAEPVVSIEADAPASTAVASRRERILARLQAILFEMSGIRLDETCADATFVELGFDSLLLTQARQVFQNEWGVKVTFRQLLEEIATPAALADHLDAQMPADRESAPALRPGKATSTPGEIAQLQARLAQLTTAAAAPQSASAAPGGGRGFGPFRPVAKARDTGLNDRQQRLLRLVRVQRRRRRRNGLLEGALGGQR